MYKILLVDTLLCFIPFRLNLLTLQVDSLKHELEEFYGKDPLESKDLSRIGNSYHFARLTKLLDEDKVSDRVVHGGQRDETRL